MRVFFLSFSLNKNLKMFKPCLNQYFKFKPNLTKKPDNQLIIRLLLSGEYRIRTDDPLPARQVL